MIPSRSQESCLIVYDGKSNVSLIYKNRPPASLRITNIKSVKFMSYIRAFMGSSDTISFLLLCGKKNEFGVTLFTLMPQSWFDWLTGVQ